jgi:hypothetical protein
MNPALPTHVIDKALAKDAPKARAEYLNVWREDLSDYIPADEIDNCTAWGTFERPPQPGIFYQAYADCAGGVMGETRRYWRRDRTEAPVSAR